MMINNMKIDKLFGRFDYDIVFKKEGVTILTGPNGFGKSTILKCLKVLSEGIYEKFLIYFSRLSFNKIELYSDESEQKFSIIKNNDEIIINEVKFPLKKGNNFSEQKIIKVLGDDRWSERTPKEIFITEEYNFKDSIDFNDYLYEPSIINKKISKKCIEILKQIKEMLGPIHFIEEQRLLMQKTGNRPHSNRVVDVIEELPNKFKNLIRNVSSNYSATANMLDSTYPYRLFNTESGINEEEYNEKMIEMKNKFEKLRKYDISEMQNSTNVFFKKEHAKALKIYFEDFSEKYKVYEDFVKKLDLFTDIVNSRLKFKKIKISRENGIIITDDNCFDNALTLNQLSSGEKQEIVLFYDLIFEASNNELLLIDEPEISLHITWQKMFMDDLLKIVEYKGLKVIVATHSPQIINNHWDIQVDLGDLYGSEFNKN